ncbi:antibiotic biosynthesis monooxygenase family protein [Turneriella parva]|uniref:Antibiotic biosynthesis monooxygenase n=1 Tax=Turneriella parva (strain ATCC BAA-1111 / DSM 21527 / NCTC 11395 / H) TaxID=869212 RepID=I4B495_TURPD|nr:antibiotic biosynthesis monooxygenase [Turneriella parva]AFM12102.1 Antibiotic biosynthesis monooxygenase [Turneriella parva DSM 21527]
MILELAILDVKPGREAEFVAAFAEAQQYIMRIEGYISHSLQKCIERPGRYLLLVNWHTLEAHTVGFRASPEYAEWKKLLHHFYEPFPTVEHYEKVLG